MIEDNSPGSSPGLVEVLDALVEAVILLAPDSEIELANRTARAWLGGHEEHPVEHQTIESALRQWLLTSDDGDEVGLDRLLTVQAVGSPVRAVHRETGELRWWRPACRLLSGTDEHQPARLLVLEDVTAVKQAEVRTRVLADSGRALIGSLDFEQRLANVVQLAVPSVADWCAVYLVDENLNLSRLVSAHRTPEKRALAQRIAELVGDHLNPTTDVGRVIQTGDSILHEDISSELLARRARTAEELRLLRALELRSAVIVPLCVPDRAIGAMVLASAESRRQFTHDDRELAEQLGRRAAVAIENARLHKQVSDVAQTLARSFLPPALPEVPGWEVATLYRPIVSELRIELGGDFLDMLAVGSCWFAVIGDIEGKGVLAATVGALMRHGTRLAAQHGPSPASVLEQLDEALKSHPSDVTSTMVCARLGEAELSLASAGHPPPLVANLDGETRELRAQGPMLGAFSDPEWLERTFPVATGELVVFYTDGITEALGGRKSLGRNRLRMLLASQAGRRPAEVVEALDRALGHATVRDDLAALVLRRR